MRRERYVSRWILAIALAGAIVLAGFGCGGSVTRPDRLLDGSAAPRAPAALRRAVGRSVVSRVRVLRAGALGVRGRGCLDGFRSEFAISPRALVVARTGAFGASLTAADALRRVVVGCDRTGLPTGSRWCARSVGRLHAGRLRDSRIDILCRDSSGRPLAFGWIEPARDTRWVVVAGPGTVERTAAGLPVRVVTHDVDMTSSSATFHVSEYRSDGSLLRRYSLEAVVAG